MEQQVELEYVGFWLRVWAFVIDSVLIAVLMIPLLTWVFGSFHVNSFIGLGSDGRDAFVNILLPALAVIAFWTHKGATPGKMAIGASIVDARTGAAPSTVQFISRYIGYFVSMIPLFLGLAWVGWDVRKQGWHDKLSNTVVVRPRVNGTPVRFEAAAVAPAVNPPQS